MSNVPSEVPTAERARWLAEVSQTLDEAQRLISRLELSGERRALARELFLQIEMARLEVEVLRLSRSVNRREDTDPKWRDFSTSVAW